MKEVFIRTAAPKKTISIASNAADCSFGKTFSSSTYLRRPMVVERRTSFGAVSVRKTVAHEINCVSTGRGITIIVKRAIGCSGIAMHFVSI
ncbi:uncharacterized protein ARMOST_14779 [Armillaria ostoyae]|uniref:Uncharacterized protein n=1 Tax=Armillaria ostoyae TaxID=47428 RepID=A0A284RRI1_ARMOS|nr:uncharacterized protein ARMOST_14779 [Armillaria ostoyae]